jgi:hypothetical protein
MQSRALVGFTVGWLVVAADAPQGGVKEVPADLRDTKVAKPGAQIPSHASAQQTRLAHSKMSSPTSQPVRCQRGRPGG